MNIRRILTIFTVVILLEVAVFQVVYRDLLWLNQPVAALQAEPVDLAGDTVRDALSRPHLSRRHLEALAAATVVPALLDEHVTALQRLHQLDPHDQHVTIRLAEAYRRAGRFDQSRRLFIAALEAPAP